MLPGAAASMPTRDEVEALAAQDRPLPVFVREAFEAYLRCGVLEHGFLRVVREHCHVERLVAFSCKQRGFCPSCGARRMAESARYLVEDAGKQGKQGSEYSFRSHELYADPCFGTRLPSRPLVGARHARKPGQPRFHRSPRAVERHSSGRRTQIPKSVVRVQFRQRRTVLIPLASDSGFRPWTELYSDPGFHLRQCTATQTAADAAAETAGLESILRLLTKVRHRVC
jgi:hypothetical protein